MKTAIIVFTNRGERLSQDICKDLDGAYIFINKNVSGGIKSVLQKIFISYDNIIFISAVGIAVRMLAPYIKSKTEDPAVVVMDDMGKYAVSLLSGHIGGANSLAKKLEKITGAEAIITTASDGRNIEAVDMFAKRLNLHIEDMKMAKKITAIMVNGGNIYYESEIKASIGYDNINNKNYEGAIYVTSLKNISCDKPVCILVPKNLVVGIGCKRGKSKMEILNALEKVFKENNLNIRSICGIASIDIKKNEMGIVELSKQLNCPFFTFSKEDICKVQHMFTSSDFVKSKVGVTSVCEPCAYLAGGELIVKKSIVNGITIAVGRKK